MSDFIDRLRAASDDASLDCYALCEEAADRIEALENALRHILSICEKNDIPLADDIGGAALAVLYPEEFA